MRVAPSLPGVTVTVTQTDTGFTRTVATEANGTWVMTNLPTGPYRLEISLQGFKSYVQTGIVLQVGALADDQRLAGRRQPRGDRVGRGAAPLVDVRSAGISTVVEQERIVELPLQGARSPI